MPERVNNCAACIVERRGIKIRVAVQHTCYKGEAGYKEPEHTFYNGGGEIKDGKYYKVFYHQFLFCTTRATKYSIKRGQFINGYKVPPAQDVWIPKHLHFDGDSKSEKFIWLHEEHYNQMAFV